MTNRFHGGSAPTLHCSFCLNTTGLSLSGDGHSLRQHNGCSDYSRTLTLSIGRLGDSSVNDLLPNNTKIFTKTMY